MNIIQTPDAPQAIGPYAQAVAVDGWLFTSGQIPLNAAGELVDGDVTVQTTQVLDNLHAVLTAAGGGFDKVGKTTVFLADMNDFAAMNAVYAARFGSHTPARSTVQVARLPKAAKVEIEVIAVK